MSYTFWLEVSIWHSPQSLLDRWDRPGHRSCPGRWDRPGHRFFDPLICPPPPPLIKGGFMKSGSGLAHGLGAKLTPLLLARTIS